MSAVSRWKEIDKANARLVNSQIVSFEVGEIIRVFEFKMDYNTRQAIFFILYIKFK